MILTNWQGLSEAFKERRGQGLSYHTIQGFQAQGMPHIRQGRRVFFDLEACWRWYVERFTVAA